MRILLFVFLICFTSAISVSAQKTDDGESTSRLQKITLAITDADGNIVEDPDEITTEDVPIYCYVDLNGDEPALIRVRFIAVKAKGVRPNTEFVTLRYKTKQGDTGASFHVSPEINWSEGDYRIDVYIDGALVVQREFKISQ